MTDIPTTPAAISSPPRRTHFITRLMRALGAFITHDVDRDFKIVFWICFLIGSIATFIDGVVEWMAHTSGYWLVWVGLPGVLIIVGFVLVLLGWKIRESIQEIRERLEHEQ